MGRPTKKLSQKEIEIIKDLYLTTQLNKQEIASKLHVSATIVNNLLKELNIPKKNTKAKGVSVPSKRVVVDLIKVKELREELYSFEQIAKILKVSVSTIEKCIKEDPNFIDCPIRSNKKLAGKVDQVIDKYKQTSSITKTADYFNVCTKVISKLLKHRSIKIESKPGFYKGHKRSLKHGHCSKGNKSKEWKCYKGILSRCNDNNSTGYEHYGGRGIQCKFNSFEEFLAEIGLAPGKEYSVDRINNNGHYEKGNVRWATNKEQARNKRTNVITEDIARQLREAHISVRLPGALSVKQLAKLYNLDYSHAKKVSRGEQWQ